MQAFIVFGFFGSLFLSFVAFFAHLIYVLVRKHSVFHRIWLIPAVCFVIGYGYSAFIFIGEGEGSLVGVGESIGSALRSGLPIYLFILSFFCALPSIATLISAHLIFDAKRRK